MRLVRVASIRDDMELARDIPTGVYGTQPLLRRGVKLTLSLAQRLAAKGVRAVWIEDDMGDGIVPAQPLPDHVREATERAVTTCLEAARSLEGSLSYLPTQSFGQIESAAERLVAALSDCPEAALALDDLSGADSYTYRHSVRVATLGLLLGQRIDRLDGWVDYRGEVRFDRREERMTQLTMGLLIHDIGKLAIPESILNKPGELTPAEWELMKSHPTAGASMLPAGAVSVLTRCVVRDHHERWDGLGYPAGRQGEEIHPFARIAAVADVYDAITADRPYRSATAPHIGVRVIRDGAGTQFEERVVEHFLRVAMPYPVGHTLTMPDGTQCVVAGVDPSEPEYPVIRYRTPDGQLAQTAAHVVDGVVRALGGEPVTPPAGVASGDPATYGAHVVDSLRVAADLLDAA